MCECVTHIQKTDPWRPQCEGKKRRKNDRWDSVQRGHFFPFQESGSNKFPLRDSAAAIKQRKAVTQSPSLPACPPGCHSQIKRGHTLTHKHRKKGTRRIPGLHPAHAVSGSWDVSRLPFSAARQWPQQFTASAQGWPCQFD